MMRKTSVLLAGVAVAVLAGSVGSAFAQDTMKRRGAPKYRPLTVQAPADTNPLTSPVGAGLGVVGSTLTGATSLAIAPLQALGGGPVGISADPAPPLPIRARYANTGKVTTSYDRGYAQDVPVDASGPIYKIDGTTMRNVTPFTLAAFPVAGLASAITTPFRPATP